ncbi:lipid II flippase MurJ [Bifidobacterium xylocopae]|uniref:Virulence factor protein n=1 Tax=Bifidobacterium xylocopae TaxID=2493119 RepID=A0A366KD51_9BIFI|nr:lipid II flippase MurJ [Bifidobacterium xylocopae]RBP99675.1 hypothetical protein CRD59_02820 [Bifidobacterium xylocopae]
MTRGRRAAAGRNGGTSQDSVGRNSIIMASGTAASRVTGQIRTILLAAAIGTTGIAADAYQTGAMIPQVMFTLISGGIFNAVLVPQIVRTLKEEDAEDRLNKLITASIALLAGLTLVLMLGTSVLTSIYLNSKWNPAQRALANAFTLWCMPQVFFYGLYTVLGQILAATGRFTAYAWSSVGANVISCAGFLAFIAMFGNAQKQPMDFWTTDKVGLTAGAWTLGVAFQAVVLFIPLIRSGFTYRPRWGLKGIGLRSMGPVAAWSLGVVVIDQLANIVNARITNGAPLEGNPFDIAGNGSYQNAYTLYMLPYSLIAVSVSTAIFPQLSQAIADGRLGDARQALSRSLRNVGLMMCFFSVVMLVIPVPIVRALLPSVSVHEAVLISGPLLGLTLGLAAVSAFLLIQRTFYAFEDGRQPFVFAAISNAVQVIMILVAVRLAPARYWTALVGLTMALSNIVSFPFLIHMLKRRFEGFLDGRRILATYARSLLAAVISGGLALLAKNPVTRMVGAEVDGRQGHMSWLQAVLICLVITLFVTVIYCLLLSLLHTNELTILTDGLVRRLGLEDRFKRLSTRTGSILAASDLPANPVQVQAALTGQPGRVIRSYSQPTGADDMEGALEQIENASLADAGSMNPQAWKQPVRIVPMMPAHMISRMHPSLGSSKASALTGNTGAAPTESPDAGLHAAHAGPADSAGPSGSTPAAIPTSAVSGSHIAAQVPSATTPAPHSPNPTPSKYGVHENPGIMKPSTNDILLDRYQLEAQLRRSPGLSVWRAQDKVLDRPCQLFIVTDAKAVGAASAAASTLALSSGRRFTPVYQLHARDGIALIVTGLDPGISLAERLQGPLDGHALSFESMRTIIGESAQALATLRSAGLDRLTISPGLIRLAGSGVTVADAPVLTMLEPWQAGETPGTTGDEGMTVRQLSAVLYTTLTGSMPVDNRREPFDLAALPQGTPEEFRIICARGLDLHTPDGEEPTPLVTLAELTALLGPWTPPEELTDRDIIWPDRAGRASIETVQLKPVREEDVLDLPDSLYIAGAPVRKTLAEPRWGTNQLLFPDRSEVEMLDPSQDDADLFSLFDERRLQRRRTSSEPVSQSERATWPTRTVDVTTLRRARAMDEEADSDLFAQAGNSPSTDENDGRSAAGRTVPSWDFAPYDSDADTGNLDLSRPLETDPADLPGDGQEETDSPVSPKAGGRRAHPSPQRPPSFAPSGGNVVPSLAYDYVMDEGEEDGTDNEEDVADARLLGRFTTKSVVIALGACLLVIGLVWASINLVGHRGAKSDHDGSWPDMSNVPFPSDGQRPSPDQNGAKSEGKSATQPHKTSKVQHGSRSASAVPKPHIPTNTTAYPTTTQTFLSHPAGQSGYAWYVRLDAPHEVSRLEVSIRQQGGHGQVYANATGSTPTAGGSLADFSFDPSGVTKVMLKKPVTTQDLIIWVPQDGLPEGGTLHFNGVQAF